VIKTQDSLSHAILNIILFGDGSGRQQQRSRLWAVFFPCASEAYDSREGPSSGLAGVVSGRLKNRPNFHSTPNCLQSSRQIDPGSFCSARPERAIQPHKTRSRISSRPAPRRS